MATTGTHLAGISGINGYQFDASKKRFVFQLKPQIKEAPGMLNSPLAFSNPYPVADAFEVFNGNTPPGAFSLFNNLLGDAVIYVTLESGFLALALLKQSFGRFRTFSLELSSETCISGSGVVKLTAREGFSITCGGDFNDSQVYSQEVIRLTLRWLWNFNTNVEVEHAINIHKVGLTSNTAQVEFSVIAKDEGYVNSVGQGFEIDNVGLLELPDSVVIDYGTMLSELMVFLFVSLIGFLDLAYGADSHLSRQSELFSDVIVAELVQPYLACYMLFVSHIRDIVAGSVEGFHSLKKLLFLFFVSLEFQFKCKYHVSIVTYIR